MDGQRKLTEKLLFDYYLVSSQQEEEVFSQHPFLLDKAIFAEMQAAVLVLDGLVRRLIETYLAGKSGIALYVETVPYLDQILALPNIISPFFWVRYDAFIREDGGIFFSEFNYDKPCAQREILFNNLMQPVGNPNNLFGQEFVQGLTEQWCGYVRNKHEAYRLDMNKDTSEGCSSANCKPTVGIMVDPNHFEELHLAYLYKDLLSAAGYPCLIAGGKNFRVHSEHVFAFGQQIDIILRQYPTEHGDEIIDFPAILELYAKGQVLLVNDPRTIFGQGKVLFATLWSLLDNDSFPLTPPEVKAIQQYIPRTWLYQKVERCQASTEKDKYVLKANYGRYSEEVYIGRLYGQQEWEEVLDYIEAGEKTFVIQEFCPSKRWVIPRFNGDGYQDTIAYGNFGLYLTNGKFSGVCLRCSPSILTGDYSWFSPVGISETCLETQAWWKEKHTTQRKDLWRAANEAAAFELGYTGGYTGGREAFSLTCLQLQEGQIEELYRASEQMLKVFARGLELILSQPEILGPVLGVSGALLDLAAHSLTASLGVLGRLDWVFDHAGKLKLLEFNAETPAGLLESVGLNRLVSEVASEQGYRLGADPNEVLSGMIRAEFARILGDYEKYRPINTIGFVSSNYYEDWYHTNFLYDIVKALPYRFVIGEIRDLNATGGRLRLYDTPLDAIYRYYPLDWLVDIPGACQALMQSTPSLNPTHTYFLQSKAFLALLYHLAANDYFSKEDETLIEKYIPKTVLRPDAINYSYVVKPYFAREGQGVVYSENIHPGDVRKLWSEDYVFQERVYLQQVDVDLFGALPSQQLPMHVVLGVYTVDCKPAGIYTRAGAGITGKEAIFLPTYVRR